MKRIAILIVPLLFVVNVGCGKKKSKNPPPAPQASKESLKDLECVAELAEQICCGEYSAAFKQNMQYCTMMEQATANAPQTAGYNLPQPPQAPNSTPAQPPVIAGCSPSTQPLNCQQAIQNFELQYKTTYKDKAPKDAEEWRQDTGKSVITCVGEQNGINSMDQFDGSNAAQCAAALTQQQMQGGGGMPAGAAGMAAGRGMAPGTLTTDPGAGSSLNLVDGGQSPLPATNPNGLGTAPTQLGSTNSGAGIPVEPSPTGTTGTSSGWQDLGSLGQGFASKKEVLQLSTSSIPKDF